MNITPGEKLGMSEIIIRNYKKTDLKKVIPLLKELQEVTNSHQELSEHSLSSIFKEMSKYPEIYINLIAEIDKKVVGFISLILYRTLFHSGGTALINE